MKSKTSFINKTMLQKNVKLYWPIWTLYTIVLLLNGPFSMWSRFKSAEFIYGTNWHKYMLDIMSPAISMEADMIFIFVMALVTGMAMFSYLYNSRACNMIHAMPVTRRQLFSTNVLTGLLFMWIPQIVKYIMSFVICISYGNTKVVHIGINLLATMGISFFMYSLVCLCAMITGADCFCSSDVCAGQSAVWWSSYCYCQCAHICIVRAFIYGICKENKCYVVCSHATASQSGRLSSDHEECRG